MTLLPHPKPARIIKLSQVVEDTKHQYSTSLTLYSINSILSNHQCGHIACSHIWEVRFQQGVPSFAMLYLDHRQHPPSHQPVTETTQSKYQ